MVYFDKIDTNLETNEYAVEVVDNFKNKCLSNIEPARKELIESLFKVAEIEVYNNTDIMAMDQLIKLCDGDPHTMSKAEEYLYVRKYVKAMLAYSYGQQILRNTRLGRTFDSLMDWAEEKIAEKSLSDNSLIKLLNIICKSVATVNAIPNQNNLNIQFNNTNNIVSDAIQCEIVQKVKRLVEARNKKVEEPEEKDIIDVIAADGNIDIEEII